MVAVYELHVHEIIVMGHDDCGMLHTTADSLCRHMVEEGIDETAIDAIRPQLKQWADPVTDVDTSVCDTVRRLRANPYLPKSLTIYGMVIHPHTGENPCCRRWRRPEIGGFMSFSNRKNGRTRRCLRSDEKHLIPRY